MNESIYIDGSEDKPVVIKVKQDSETVEVTAPEHETVTVQNESWLNHPVLVEGGLREQ